MPRAPGEAAAALAAAAAWPAVAAAAGWSPAASRPVGRPAARFVLIGGLLLRITLRRLALGGLPLPGQAPGLRPGLGLGLLPGPVPLPVAHRRLGLGLVQRGRGGRLPAVG